MPKSIRYYLHLFAFKSPTKRAEMNETSAADCAFQTRNGVNPFRWFKKKKDKEMEMAVYEDIDTFVPIIEEGKIVRIHDGNTVTVATRIFIEGKKTMRLYRFTVRLRGVDASLKEGSREALQDFIFGKIVKMQGINYDKYGRLCGDINTLDRVNVGEWMINNGQAVPISGKGNYVPNEWVDIPIS